MKSPAELAEALARQWHSADQRERRLLDPTTWPLPLTIGHPPASVFESRTAEVRAHIERWRAVGVGTVEWQETRYRSAAEAVLLPSRWMIPSPDAWADASADARVQHEYHQLRQLLDATDPVFHRVLVRQRGLWRDRALGETAQAAALSLELAPGVAAGRPLRALSLGGIDSKFIERNRGLLTALLDVRFDGQASELGLAAFLDAADEGEHWLLLAPLADGLLPFAQLRVRARELQHAAVPASRLLLVENERCLHQLPRLHDTVAILGSGLDLAWLRADWLAGRRIGYWGDMDTWGLQMLARARRLQPQVKALLMDRRLFERFAPTLAVKEPTPAAVEPPQALTPHERDFYAFLHSQPRGRIEQEFLPPEVVADALAAWA